ncbi:hypothetical protein B0T20DRAFT_458513 [Sordaria brevicollis]|uniref:Pentatricopeptide repeat protein n=1 Tax=Sordaria brevicollis TaxID=83679 RepID=A0AAE0PP50_SORBR|nr:hypothetical protein B0T20DRAFT_458513 [Sordaria brevicollis]
MQQSPFICRSCLSNIRRQADPLQLRLPFRPRPLVRPASSVAASPQNSQNFKSVAKTVYDSNIGDYSQWKADFAEVWDRRELDEEEMNKHRATLLESRRPEIYIIQDLLCQRDVDYMRQAWELMPKEYRAKLWQPVMLNTLELFPDRAPDIFRAIFEENGTNFYSAVDSFLYMTEYLERLEGPMQSEYGRAVADALLFCYRNTKERYICLRQNTIYRILKNATTEQAYDLLTTIKAYRQPLHVNTKQQFVWYLAKTPEYKPAAADLLREMIHKGELDVNGLHSAALATAILTFPIMRKQTQAASKEDDENLPVLRSQLNQELLELGLQPNIIHYTTIVRNLCDNDELGTAWQVYDLMTSQGVQADFYFWSHMLHGATLKNDHGSFRRILELLPVEAWQDPVITNGVLAFIYTTTIWELRKRRMKPPVPIPSFEYMFRTYSKIFDLGPLQSLLNIDLETYTTEIHQRELENMSPSWSNWQSMRSIRSILQHVPDLGPEAKLQPGNDTLNMMVVAFIRNFSQPYSLIEFYSNFRTRLKRGDPTILSFVNSKGTMVHDTIIKAIMEWQGTNMARVALDIVSDMLKDAAASRALFDADPNKPDLEPRHPAPNVYTWSVLLHGFMHRREHREQGDRIFKMMREHGVDPNRVTWNTLIAGHARLQAVGNTASALQRMEAAGYKPDRFTLRAFSYLLNRDGALQMMQRLEDKKNRRHAAFVAKLAQQAAEKHEEEVKVPEWIAAADEYRIMEEQLRDISESVVDSVESVGGDGEDGEGEEALVDVSAEAEWDAMEGMIEAIPLRNNIPAPIDRGVFTSTATSPLYSLKQFLPGRS